MAVNVITETGSSLPASSVNEKWKTRIKEAQKDRARLEPTWQTVMAFAAGKHHLKWSRRQRKLVLPELAKGRERYSVDEITQYRLTAVGELSHDTDLPTVQFRQDDVESEKYAAQVNDGLRYCWDEEADGDMVMLGLKFNMVDFGTAAIRCRFDPTRGPKKAKVPTGRDGRAQLGDAALASLEKTGQLPDGSLPKFKQTHEGVITLELGGPFNLLVPPGVEHDRDFPWEVWVRPVAISALVDEYGEIAAGLKEDPLAAVHMLGTNALSDISGADDAGSGQPGKLDGHVLVFTCYERATGKNSDGEMVVLAGSDEMRPLTTPAPLPYVAPDGTPRSGITYFRYVTVPGRWWGKGLVEGLKDPQRMIDRRRQQISETIDRGQPWIGIEEGSITSDREGTVLEVVEFKPGTAPPSVNGGLNPGPWMQGDIEALREDLDRASGIRGVSLGENPANVGTYSQLALLRESDQIKRIPIIAAYHAGVAQVIADLITDMRRYWGTEKQVTLAGEDDGLLQSAIFNASRIPAFFKVMVPKGGGKPVTQAAQLQMITDLANYSVQARQPLPPSWYFESLQAGKPLPLPTPESDAQLEKAQLENARMAQGEPQQVAYFDPGLVHVPQHRRLQIDAALAGRQDIADLAEQHIQEHLQVEQQKAAQAPPQPPQGPQGPPPIGGSPVPVQPVGPGPQPSPAFAA